MTNLTRRDFVVLGLAGVALRGLPAAPARGRLAWAAADSRIDVLLEEPIATIAPVTKLEIALAL